MNYGKRGTNKRIKAVTSAKPKMKKSLAFNCLKYF